MKTLRIGVVGYSAQKFDESEASSILLSAFQYLAIQHQADQIEVVSGLTLYGIPKLAYQIAAQQGYLTRGVAPRCALAMPCFNCNDVTIVGETWGDESETFLSCIDVLLRVGGGKQSHTETNIAKERGLSTMEFELDVQE